MTNRETTEPQCLVNVEGLQPGPPSEVGPGDGVPAKQLADGVEMLSNPSSPKNAGTDGPAHGAARITVRPPERQSSLSSSDDVVAVDILPSPTSKPSRAPICAPELKPPPLPPSANGVAAFPVPPYPVSYNGRFLPRRHASAFDLAFGAHRTVPQFDPQFLEYQRHPQFLRSISYNAGVSSVPFGAPNQGGGQLTYESISGPGQVFPEAQNGGASRVVFHEMRPGVNNPNAAYGNLATDPGAYFQLYTHTSRSPTDPGMYSNMTSPDAGVMPHHLQAQSRVVPGPYAGMVRTPTDSGMYMPAPQRQPVARPGVPFVRQGTRTPTDPGHFHQANEPVMLTSAKAQRSPSFDSQSNSKTNQTQTNIQGRVMSPAYRSSHLAPNGGAARYMTAGSIAENSVGIDEHAQLGRRAVPRRNSLGMYCPQPGLSVAAVPAVMMENAGGRQHAAALALAAASGQQPGGEFLSPTLSSEQQSIWAAASPQQQQEQLKWQVLSNQQTVTEAGVLASNDSSMYAGLLPAQALTHNARFGNMSQQHASGTARTDEHSSQEVTMPLQMAMLVQHLQQVQQMHSEETNEMRQVIAGVQQLLAEQNAPGAFPASPTQLPSPGQRVAAEEGLPWWHISNEEADMRFVCKHDEEIAQPRLGQIPAVGSGASSFTAGTGSLSTGPNSFTTNCNGSFSSLSDARAVITQANQWVSACGNGTMEGLQWNPTLQLDGCSAVASKNVGTLPDNWSAAGWGQQLLCEQELDEATTRALQVAAVKRW